MGNYSSGQGRSDSSGVQLTNPGALSKDYDSVSTMEIRTLSSTVSSVASSASNVTLLAANTSRRMAAIYNDSTQVLYVKVGSATASSTSYTVKMSPDAYYEIPFPACTGIVDGIWASANGNARITEW